MILNLFYKDNEHEEDAHIYTLGYLTQYSYGSHNFNNHINTDTESFHIICTPDLHCFCFPYQISAPDYIQSEAKSVKLSAVFKPCIKGKMMQWTALRTHTHIGIKLQVNTRVPRVPRPSIHVWSLTNATITAQKILVRGGRGKKTGSGSKAKS